MRVPRAHSYVYAMTEIVDVKASSEPGAKPQSAAWLRIFALAYDPLLRLGEIAGMRRRRAALLADAYGRVVEIGAGTGLNVAHYPEAVTELVLTEPEPGMRKKLSRRVRQCGSATRIVDATAERLPLADASVDTVVSTLALCTVDEPERALREIARVLRPGGQLLFIEHVRASSRLLAACQDKLVEPWRHFAAGCRCNRDTVGRLRACGYTVAAQNVVWRGMPAIVHPLAIGRATRTVTASVEHESEG
ncbi:methyltransferase type 11 [Mycolicibacterium acapulense]|nr:methyltransferase type 11 [Mycolicibacterium acapulense]